MTNLRQAAVVAVIGVIAGAALAGGLMVHKHRDGVWVPCDVAEISPDVPVQLRQWCRKQRGWRVKP